MYRNIVFDIGGVIIDYNPKKYLLELLCDEKAEAETYELVFNSDAWMQLDIGLISRTEANALMLEAAEKAGRLFEVQAIIDDWGSMLRPNHKLLDLIRKLHKNGYRIYYLTNAPRDVMLNLRAKRYLSNFDGGLASSTAHILKPDSRMYTELMRHYGLQPDETIFVDDHKTNVRAAYDLGITGIHYTTFAKLVENLITCGIPLKARTKADLKKKGKAATPKKAETTSKETSPETADTTQTTNT